MKNGLYERSGFKIAIYELEGNKNHDAFVVVTNESCPNEPLVLTGEKALKLIQALAEHLNKDDKEES